TIACHAGAASAPQTPSRNVKARSTVGVTAFSHTSPANTAPSTVVAISTPMSSPRRSTMSARAPAGNAKRKIGRVVITCTSETVRGSGARLVISQPAAVLYIAAPVFATTVVPHITANAVWRNAAHAAPATFGACTAGLLWVESDMGIAAEGS